MDGKKARQIAGSRAFLIPATAICAISMASIFWNLQLSHSSSQRRDGNIPADSNSIELTGSRRQNTLEGEKLGSIKTTADPEQARLIARRQAERVKDAARVRELYEELNRLTELNEKILLDRKAVGNLPVPRDHSIQVTAPKPPIINSSPIVPSSTVR
jgi:hypothetical protein